MNGEKKNKHYYLEVYGTDFSRWPPEAWEKADLRAIAQSPEFAYERELDDILIRMKWPTPSASLCDRILAQVETTPPSFAREPFSRGSILAAMAVAGFLIGTVFRLTSAAPLFYTDRDQRQILQAAPLYSGAGLMMAENFLPADGDIHDE